MIDEAYGAAWADRDNQKVMRAASLPYTRGEVRLGDEAVVECMQVALLRCLRGYDPARGRKFTTSLHTFTAWECARAIRSERRHREAVRVRRLPRSRHRDHALDRHLAEEAVGEVLDGLGRLGAEDQALIRSRYLGGEPLWAIGAEGCPRVALDGALARLREALSVY